MRELWSTRGNPAVTLVIESRNDTFAPSKLCLLMIASQLGPLTMLCLGIASYICRLCQRYEAFSYSSGSTQLTSFN